MRPTWPLNLIIMIGISYANGKALASSGNIIRTGVVALVRGARILGITV